MSSAFSPDLAAKVRAILSRKVRAEEADATCETCGYALVELPRPADLPYPRPMGQRSQYHMAYAHLAGEEGGDGSCVYPDPVACRFGLPVRLTADGVPECDEPAVPGSEYCRAHQED